jgi:hypothetical protein
MHMQQYACTLPRRSTLSLWSTTLLLLIRLRESHRPQSEVTGEKVWCQSLSCKLWTFKYKVQTSSLIILEHPICIDIIKSCTRSPTSVHLKSHPSLMSSKIKAMLKRSTQNDKFRGSIEQEPESAGGVSLRGQSPSRCRSPLLTGFHRSYTVYQCSGYRPIHQS